jgi:hypothetical protein
VPNLISDFPIPQENEMACFGKAWGTGLDRMNRSFQDLQDFKSCSACVPSLDQQRGIGKSESDAKTARRGRLALPAFQHSGNVNRPRSRAAIHNRIPFFWSWFFRLKAGLQTAGIRLVPVCSSGFSRSCEWGGSHKKNGWVQFMFSGCFSAVLCASVVKVVLADQAFRSTSGENMPRRFPISSRFPARDQEF